MRKALLRVTLLPCLMFMSACTTLSTPPVCHDFEGIKTALNRENTVSVLIVHGMSGYSEGDPNTLVCGITRELCLCPDGEPCHRQIIRETPYKWYGCLARQDYCGMRCPYRLRTYILDWRPATWHEKSLVRDIDESWCKRCKRLAFVDKLKRDFVNNGLGDVALYCGGYREEICYPFQQAIRWITADSNDDPCHEIIIVAFSMGGQLLLDSLDCMRDVTVENHSLAAKIRETFIKKTSAFFMLSNQIPLLELANLQPAINSYQYCDKAPCDPCQQCCPTATLRETEKIQQINWPETALGHFINDRRTTLPDFRIVSISDPNDLISYSFHGYNDYCQDSTSSCEGYFLNASILNVRTAYFGLINPAKAHQCYGQNGAVIRMIVHGCGMYR